MSDRQLKSSMISILISNPKEMLSSQSTSSWTLQRNSVSIGHQADDNNLNPGLTYQDQPLMMYTMTLTI